MIRYVYVAGPISKGDVQENIRRGIEAGLHLLKAGYAPMIPHLSCYAQPDALLGTTAYEWWLELDLAFIEVCDAVIRLPGESAGADRETAYAETVGVPVFLDLDALLNGVPPRQP